MSSGTPTLHRFLTEISRLLRAKNGIELGAFLIIEPPYPDIYNSLIDELRSAFPSSKENSATVDGAIEAIASSLLPETRDGLDGSATWSAFIKFMRGYLSFLRDVDIGNLLGTYGLLSELLGKANSALTHPSLGALILPTVVSYSGMLARLAIGLDQQPHLIAHSMPTSETEDSGPTETLPERAANTVRQAFVTCLNDRSSSGTTLGPDGHPEGKKRGIYTLANICLKILFACHKIRNASQIFENIYTQSPPLSAYPKAERVTYLYFLGRFLWANGHAYRALKALEAAWTECHSTFSKQKRLILVYLTASNMVCGRFPSAALLARAEARGLGDKFGPVCLAIKHGDLANFRRLLSPGSAEYEWFAFWSIDVQIRNRCQVYVWRSLIRSAFCIVGDPGNPEARKAPTLDLTQLVTLWQWQETQSIDPARPASSPAYVDPDFDGLEAPAEGNLSVPVDLAAIVSIMSSLIHQDLLNGYLSLKMQKFAIQGARQKGPVAAGFPNIWKVIQNKCDDEVPGWKQVGTARQNIGPGMVLNLTGVRPIAAMD